MEWIPELESTCAALGTSDGVKYHKDPECLECVKDLIRSSINYHGLWTLHLGL